MFDIISEKYLVYNLMYNRRTEGILIKIQNNLCMKLKNKKEGNREDRLKALLYRLTTFTDRQPGVAFVSQL